MFEQLLGQYGWIAITFGLGFFFKESIINMIQGMQVFIGNAFNSFYIFLKFYLLNQYNLLSFLQ